MRNHSSPSASVCSDIWSLYGVVRQLTGAKDNTNIPIIAKDGRLLLTEIEQNLRWKEHFKEVLNQPEPLSTPDFGDIVTADSLEVDEGNINLKYCTGREIRRFKPNTNLEVHSNIRIV